MLNKTSFYSGSEMSSDSDSSSDSSSSFGGDLVEIFDEMSEETREHIFDREPSSRRRYLAYKRDEEKKEKEEEEDDDDDNSDSDEEQIYLVDEFSEDSRKSLFNEKPHLRKVYEAYKEEKKRKDAEKKEGDPIISGSPLHLEEEEEEDRVLPRSPDLLADDDGASSDEEDAAVNKLRSVPVTTIDHVQINLASEDDDAEDETSALMNVAKGKTKSLVPVQDSDSDSDSDSDDVEILSSSSSSSSSDEDDRLERMIKETRTPDAALNNEKRSMKSAEKRWLQKNAQNAIYLQDTEADLKTLFAAEVQQEKSTAVEWWSSIDHLGLLVSPLNEGQSDDRILSMDADALQELVDLKAWRVLLPYFEHNSAAPPDTKNQVAQGTAFFYFQGMPRAVRIGLALLAGANELGNKGPMNRTDFLDGMKVIVRAYLPFYLSVTLSSLAQSPMPKKPAGWLVMDNRKYGSTFSYARLVFHVMLKYAEMSFDDLLQSTEVLSRTVPWNIFFQNSKAESVTAGGESTVSLEELFKSSAIDETDTFAHLLADWNKACLAALAPRRNPEQVPTTATAPFLFGVCIMWKLWVVYTLISPPTAQAGSKKKKKEKNPLCKACWIVLKRMFDLWAESPMRYSVAYLFYPMGRTVVEFANATAADAGLTPSKVNRRLDKIARMRLHAGNTLCLRVLAAGDKVDEAKKRRFFPWAASGAANSAIDLAVNAFFAGALANPEASDWHIAQRRLSEHLGIKPINTNDANMLPQQTATVEIKNASKTLLEVARRLAYLDTTATDGMAHGEVRAVAFRGAERFLKAVKQVYAKRKLKFPTEGADMEEQAKVVWAERRRARERETRALDVVDDEAELRRLERRERIYKEGTKAADFVERMQRAEQAFKRKKQAFIKSATGTKISQASAEVKRLTNQAEAAHLRALKAGEEAEKAVRRAREMTLAAEKLNAEKKLAMAKLKDEQSLVRVRETQFEESNKETLENLRRMKEELDEATERYVQLQIEAEESQAGAAEEEEEAMDIDEKE